MDGTEHLVHLEHRDTERGPWRRLHRAVCSCGWVSRWFYSSVAALEAGLDHSRTGSSAA